MLVPAAVDELDEAHAALGQAAGEQAVAGEAAVDRRRRRAVQVERLLAARSERSVSSGTDVCMRNAISYWAMRVSISGSPNARAASCVQLADAVEHRRGALAASTPGGLDRYSTGSPPVRNRTPWCCAGQEAAAPQPREERLVGLVAAALRDHDDERGQVLVLAAQAVAEPGAQARPAGLLAAGLDERDGRVVVDRLGVAAT